MSIVFMIERSTLKELSAEFVILEYLKDESAHHQFHKYIALRETLWNSTMEKLGLDYRFKCVVNYPGILDTVKCVMASSSPPTREWWNDHCYFINGRILPDALEDLELDFCDFETKFESYWPLIQVAFAFALNYKRGQYIIDTAGGFKVYQSMAEIFLAIRKAGHGDTNIIRFERFFAEIKKKLDDLTQLVNDTQYMEPRFALLEHRHWPRKRGHYLGFLSLFKYKLSQISRLTVLYLFEHYKLSDRLVRQELEGPSSGERLFWTG